MLSIFLVFFFFVYFIVVISLKMNVICVERRKGTDVKRIKELVDKMSPGILKRVLSDISAMLAFTLLVLIGVLAIGGNAVPNVVSNGFFAAVGLYFGKKIT